MYRLIDRSVIESLYGLLLDDIILPKLENGLLHEKLSKLGYFIQYIDNMFIVHYSGVSKQELLKYFISVHSAIKFIWEEEHKNSLYFLNVLFRMIDGFITTILSHIFSTKRIYQILQSQDQTIVFCGFCRWNR